MAIIHLEGFELYGGVGTVPGSNLYHNWTTVYPLATTPVIRSGRFGGYGISLPNTLVGKTYGNTYLYRATPTLPTTIIGGVGFNAVGLNLAINQVRSIAGVYVGGIALFDIVLYRGTGATANTQHLVLYYRNASTTIITTILATSDNNATMPLGLDLWQYLEFKAVVNGTSSFSIVAKLNNVELFNTTLTTSRTLAGFSGVSHGQNLIYSYSSQTSGSLYLDDMYLLDGTGTTNNDFITNSSSCTIKPLLPVADASRTAWTPNSGSIHYSRVNNMPPDGDTTYVSTATSGAVDTYSFNPLDSIMAGPILGLRRTAIGRTTTGAAVDLRHVAGSGATVTDSTRFQPGITYSGCTVYDNVNPTTGSGWTLAGINSLEAGVKLNNN